MCNLFTDYEELAALLHGFDALHAKIAAEWKTGKERHDIQLKTGSIFVHVSSRYAVLQAVMISSAHDNRLNIGSNGISGEAYNCHTLCGITKNLKKEALPALKTCKKTSRALLRPVGEKAAKNYSLLPDETRLNPRAKTELTLLEIPLENIT